MDLAILRELFSNLVTLCEQQKIHHDKVVRWKKILEKLPTYRVNEQGAIREWQEESLTDFYYHRHISHLYPVFPGKELRWQSPQSPQMQAFYQAVKLRVQGGQTGWSLAQMANVYARFGDGDKALASLDTLCRSCLTGSLFTMHNDWRKMGMTLDLDDFAPVQLDANLGLVGAVQEMLLFVSHDLLKVLPACPTAWAKGRVTRLYFQTGNISFSWNHKDRELSCQLFFQRDTTLTVAFPAHYTSLSFLGEGVEVTPGEERGHYFIQAKAGQQLTVQTT